MVIVDHGFELYDNYEMDIGEEFKTEPIYSVITSTDNSNESASKSINFIFEKLKFWMLRINKNDYQYFHGKV